MSSAGQQLIAGRIPGERIATATETADSPTFTTTETTLISVTAALVDGRTYRVRASVNFSSTVDNDDLRARIREDSSTGTIMQQRSWELTVDDQETTGVGGEPEAEYTATATSNKTFVLTGERLAGTGNCKLDAISTKPSYLYVDYIRG